MGLVKLALKNPYLVIVMALAIAVIGVTSYRRIPADLLPIFKTPAVQIITFYPGMPAVVMERDIMSRLERWTGQSNGIEHQEGKSMIGVSIVKDFFREDIDPNTAMSQVTSLAMSDLFYLPPGTIPPMVMPFDPTASIPLCLLSVSSPTMNEKDLYDIAYFELRNRLQAISGVIAPAVYGGVLRRILTYIDRDKLESRGLSPMDVVAALKSSNLMIPTGNAKFGTMDYQINSNAMFEKVKEMNDIPIKVDQGAPVFLRDVAEAQDSYQIQTNIVRLNGKRQVYVPVYRQPGANVIQVVNEVRNKSEQILQRLKEMDPRAKDLRLDVVMDQSISAKKTINGLKINVIFGALLAAISIGVFLANIRSTVIVLLLLPLGIFAAMAGLFFTGNTLNSMTIGGLMLTLGMLTDQAIVVLDNIIRHLRMGKTKMQAALDGAGEVAVPMFVAMLTTIIVFFPIVFLSGMARFLFAPLALSATFAVFGAYVMAMMVVPSYCAKFLHIHGSKHSRNDKTLTSVGGEERGMGKSGKYYESLLRATLKHKPVTLLGVFVLFLLSIFLFQRIGTELFPQIEAGQFMILVRAPSGTRVEESERLIQDIEKEIQGIIGQGDPDGMDDSSDLQMLISNIGVLMDWPAAYTPNTGPMDSFILIQLKEDTKKGAIQYSGILREHFRDRFPGIEFAFDTGGMLTAALNFGLPSPINIQIKGSLLETSYEIANAMVKEVKKVRGATDVRIAQRLDYPAIDIEVDRIKAAYLQITEEDVVKNIVTALNSSINFDPAFWIDNQNGNHYFVGAQYFEDDIVSLQTLENIPITSKKNSSPVLLKNIATFKRTTAPAVVNHHDITRVIDVYANVSGRDAGSVATEIEERIKRSPVIQDLMAKYGPKGYTYNIRGEIQSMRESFGQLGQGLLIAIILVYLLLVAQFRSFRSPLIIILTVPLGFIGVSIMLYTTGTSLNIQSFMGIITMIGLVVDYSALLVEFADKHQEEGMSIEEAIVQAARTRLRPILMTSSTAVIAVIPAAIVYGGGGGASVPLARAIIGGVVAAVVLCLFVIPPLYIYLARRRTVVTA
ncbi:MAG: efflux RND transporter permease subunit [Planctomycetes bacterium]|uniref:efflux RND transporter permease subunit n=1 Tax=Candidatus Wunengus californicus TaxID=3367619 RepID=UPI004027F0E2|nr:efflux RND transporter permease subunit [Planctomycetota bacterium]